jgi:hypothetical protein
MVNSNDAERGGKAMAFGWTNVYPRQNYSTTPTGASQSYYWSIPSSGTRQLVLVFFNRVAFGTNIQMAVSIEDQPNNVDTAAVQTLIAANATTGTIRVLSSSTDRPGPGARLVLTISSSPTTAGHCTLEGWVAGIEF